MAEYFWKMVNAFQKNSLIPPVIRIFVLKAFGCNVSKTSRIGDGCYIGSNKISIGERVFINVGGFLDGSDEIVIGDFVRIGPFVRILTGTHEYKKNVIRRDFREKTIGKKVVVEKGCWIGVNVTILPGVTIKEGCVIGAGSVIVNDTESNGLYAGSPARRIKDLPTE